MIESWSASKLKSLGWFRSAGVNKLIDPKQSAVNLINYMDVYRHFQITSKIDYQRVTAKDSEIRNANVKAGDVLFTPSSEKPTDIGHAGVVLEDLPNTVYSYHLVRFRQHDNKRFDPLFLSYLLNTQSAERHFVTRATGTTRYTLSLSDFKSLEIKFPDSLPEQKAIGGILSKVDEAIEAVENSIKAAVRLKKSLMQNLLTGKLKPDGTWRSADEFYVDEKFGKVPNGWEIKKVKDVIKLKNGKGNTTSNLRDEPDEVYKIPVYGGNGITGFFHTPLLTEETLIVGRVGEYCGNVFKTPKESWVTDNAMLVDRFLLDDFNIDFLELKLSSLNFKHYSDSTGQPKITQSGIGALAFTWPKNATERNDIAGYINSFNINLSNKHSKIQSLKKLKKSLMQNLLTGKVPMDVKKINKLLEVV